MVAGARRQTEWLGSAGFTVATAIAAATRILDQSFTGAQVSAITPFTIIRTVGTIYVRGDQVAADEFAMLGYGGMIVRESARAAGAGSIPTPITEIPDDGWFLFGTAAAASGPISGAPVHVYHFDSRASRKVQDGQAIVFTVENSDGAFGLEYWWNFRILVKTH